MADPITVDGTKAFSRVLLDAVNNILVDNQTTRDLITSEVTKLDIKLDELKKQLEISNMHNEIISDNVITVDEV